jgi:hypothetical protein
VVEKKRWVCQSIVGLTSNFKQTPLKEIKTKTLQVGIKLAGALLGLFGFQKSEKLHVTESGLFSFLGHP